MKSLCLSLLTLTFAVSALADVTADDIFHANQYKKIFGKNPETGSVCSVRFIKNDLFYSFKQDITAAETLNEAHALGAGSVYSGLFSKKLFQLELVATFGGEFSAECTFFNQCTRTKLTLAYNQDDSVRKLVEVVNNKTYSCKFH